MFVKQFYKTLNILNFFIHSPYIVKTYSLCDLVLETALALIRVSSYFSWRKEEPIMVILKSPNLPAFYGNQTHLLSSPFCRHWESRDPPQFPRCFLGWRGHGRGLQDPDISRCQSQSPFTALLLWPFFVCILNPLFISQSCTNKRLLGE